MTFEARETSNHGGAPIALYTFEWGLTTWRYTSADRDIVIGADTYTAIAIKDSGMVQGGSSNNDLTVQIDPTVPLTDLFQSTPPSSEITLTVRRKHDDDAEVLIAWKGFVTNVKRAEDDSYATVVGQTYLASFERSGLRLGWTRGCPHVLYDDECRVDPEDFAVTAEITSMDGNSVTVDVAGGHPIDWFTGGFIEWEANADGTKDHRSIQASPTALRFVLLGTTYRLEVGMTVKLYPGCNLTTDNCKNKFDNLANFGGCEQMTGKNVFDGTPIM